MLNQIKHPLTPDIFPVDFIYRNMIGRKMSRGKEAGPDTTSTHEMQRRTGGERRLTPFETVIYIVDNLVNCRRLIRRISLRVYGALDVD